VPGSPAPEGSVSARVVRRRLPAGAGFIAGREAELKELDVLLGQAGLADGGDGDGGLGGAVVISAAAGMAGVGKTALAVHWARRVAHRVPRRAAVCEPARLRPRPRGDTRGSVRVVPDALSSHSSGRLWQARNTLGLAG